jgi:hypothetical protein
MPEAWYTFRVKKLRNPVVLIVAIGIVAGIVGAGVYIKETNKKKASEQPIQSQLSTSDLLPNLLTWEDQAGFSFQYPEGLRVDRHDEDTQNYAHIEFTEPEHAGNVTIWAKDTTATSVDAWVSTVPEFAGANLIDTTLGGKPAKKILLPSPKRIIVGALDVDVIVTVEALSTTPYWDDVADTMVGSFAFIPLASESTDTAASQQYVGESYDEEEVLE